MNYRAKVIHEVRAVPIDEGYYHLVSRVVVNGNLVIERTRRLMPKIVRDQRALDQEKEIMKSELLNDETVKRAIRGTEGDHTVDPGSQP